MDCTAEWAPAEQQVELGVGSTLQVRLCTTKCRHSPRPILSRITVLAPRDTGVVVALGDLITDGEVDATSWERGWPGALPPRLAKLNILVVNAGIAGNRLLSTEPMFGDSALAQV